MKKIVLSVVYDLRVLPATFDFANFLCTSYAAALDQYPRDNFSIRIQPIIVFGKLIRENDFTTNQPLLIVQKRLYNLLLPITNLFRFIDPPILISSVFGCCNESLLSTNPIIFPYEYCYENPLPYVYYKNKNFITSSLKHDIRYLKNNAQDLESMQKLYSNKTNGPIILFVERFNSNSPDTTRNSQIEYLMKIAHHLGELFDIYFLPDFKSDTSMPSSSQIKQLPRGLDIMERSALIELADLSLLPNGGISILAFLNKNANYILLELCSDNSRYSEQWYLSQGFRPDINPYKVKSRNQIWNWKLLKLPNILQQINQQINITLQK